ncbi:hypothetical protein SAMN05216359_11532 [Roseateles sp. YR242]|uniref:hypothetical protein n=1 Tax=Roseateles sp. YR242 TaxID=1855305 RepID=UPI0008B9D68B|nr:hypothetical protein [Roseateles sp. YR242]SEL73237.1 hypothetical protein SAMN05216359_11532 [Roseateles sp. YR242]
MKSVRPPLFRTLSALGLGLAACLSTVLPAQAAGLSPLEQRWVNGMAPVIVQARQSGLPLDVAVRPEDAPDAAPVALGFVNGRCKLVLSLRGNPEGEATLARIPQGLESAALELMAAHELGHCRRYLDGAWFGLPAGFAASRIPEGLSPELKQAYLSMKSTRREEGYGDLVALAWTQQQHASLYGQLHAWLVSERSRDYIPGDHHDTLAWLRLASDPAALGKGSIFEAALSVWEQALQSEE